MTIDLVIAGKRIRLQSDDGIKLRLDERFRAFMVAHSAGPGMRAEGNPDPSATGEPDLVVEVEAGSGEIPAVAAKVFDCLLYTSPSPRD